MLVSLFRCFLFIFFVIISKINRTFVVHLSKRIPRRIKSSLVYSCGCPPNFFFEESWIFKDFIMKIQTYPITITHTKAYFNTQVLQTEQLLGQLRSCRRGFLAETPWTNLRGWSTASSQWRGPRVTIQKGIYWPSFSYASLAERERNLQWQRGVVMMGALAFF